MGQYYDWVNLDRREYMAPIDFDLGSKLFESTGIPNGLLGALHDILDREWKGDTIAFIGDYAKMPESDDNAVFKKIREQCAEYEQEHFSDGIILEHYKSVSPLYKDSEPEVREEMGHYLADLEAGLDVPDYMNTYGLDVKDPYKGCFEREGKVFRYTINDSKKEYIDSYGGEEYVIDGITYCSSPLPLLMAYGLGDQGKWLGDIIRVSDEKPPEEYTDISSKENIISNSDAFLIMYKEIYG